MVYNARVDEKGRIESKKPIPEALHTKELVPLANKYNDPHDRALLLFLYLTGCRISEALNARTKDIEKIDHPELGEVYTVKLVTLKNRRNKFRIIPILSRNYEGPMIDYVNKFVNTRGADQKIFSVSRTAAWNRLSREQLSMRAIHKMEILEKFTFSVRPHYMRHCRLTHLVQNYGYDSIKLMRFAGWTTPAPAQVYLQLNWLDLAKPMSNGSFF